MNNKEQIKKFIKDSFPDKFNTEAELEEFAQKLLENAEKADSAIKKPTGRVWKKHEIEELGIEVTPVKWKKLDS